MTVQLDKPPISGQYEEIYFDIEGPWHGQTWNYVLFTTKAGEQWVGHFRVAERPGFKAAELPSKNIACVVSGKHGFIIDTEKKIKIKDVEQDHIIDIIADDKTNSFYIATWWSVSRIDEKLNEYEVDLPIASDGIYFKENSDRKQFLEIHEIGADMNTNYDYYINLDSYTIEKKH
jgi:hypothetical protein